MHGKTLKMVNNNLSF